MGTGGKKPWVLLELSAGKSTLPCITGGKAFSALLQDLGEVGRMGRSTEVKRKVDNLETKLHMEFY